MAIKIITADDPIKVETLITTIYSNPGLGKTTLGFTANKPILLDFDHGAYRAANRGDSVKIESWEDVAGMTETDLKPYATIVVDTVGRALDFLSADIISKNSKMGQSDGSLTLKGYGALKARFTTWLKTLRLMGKDIVLIAHSTEEKSGDDLIERLDIQGGSKGEVYKVSDAMGRLAALNKRRVLNFSPSDTAFGKNPGNLKPVDVPNVASNPGFLGDVIQQIKDHLNAMTEEQAKRQNAVADWLAAIDDAETPDDFMALIDNIKKDKSGVAATVKGAIAKAAQAKGYVWDKKASEYREAA